MRIMRSTENEYISVFYTLAEISTRDDIIFFCTYMSLFFINIKPKNISYSEFSEYFNMFFCNMSKSDDSDFLHSVLERIGSTFLELLYDIISFFFCKKVMYRYREAGLCNILCDRKISLLISEETQRWLEMKCDRVIQSSSDSRCREFFYKFFSFLHFDAVCKKVERFLFFF